MTFSNLWSRLTANRTGALPTFSDGTVERLRGLQHENQEATRRLAQYRSAWDHLKARVDPGAHQERDRLAPMITELEALDARLSAQITEAEEAIRVNAVMAAEQARTVDGVLAWFTPVLQRLPGDDELARAYDHSRRLARLASELYARTGDRRYRRAADPFDELRDALTDRLKRLEKIRLSKGGAV